MITVHATAKAFDDGFVPMITLRNAKGQCVGSRTPQGGYREFRTFTNEHDATIEARLIALRIALRFPEQIKAA
ncbi:hypothetical protein [Bradyrhizobium sp. USDA 4350]